MINVEQFLNFSEKRLHFQIKGSLKFESWLGECNLWLKHLFADSYEFKIILPVSEVEKMITLSAERFKEINSSRP